MQARLTSTILILLLSVASARAAVEVTFTGGRILVVEAVQIARGRATLTLLGGGTRALEAGRSQTTTIVPDPPTALDPPETAKERQPADANPLPLTGAEAGAAMLPTPAGSSAAGASAPVETLEAASTPGGPIDY